MKTKKLNPLETKVYHKALETKEASQKVDSKRKIKDYCVGEFAIVRTYSAGVHYGRVSEIKGNKVILTESRRMHTFICLDDGDSISHIAINGISKESSINGEIPSILLEWIEVVPVSQACKDTFDAQPYLTATE